MTLHKLVLSATAATAMAVSLAGAAWAGPTTITQTIPFNTYSAPGSPAFFNDAGEPDTSSPLTADFGNTITGADVTFTDYFTFGSVYDGTGSGSVSTSGSGPTGLTLGDVYINGTAYSAAQAEAGIDGISIVAYTPDVIEITGTTGPEAQKVTFSGTATIYEVSAAPEPSAWILMIGGIGLTGLALRRRQTAVQFA